MFEIHVGELRATFLRNHNMRRHKDPSRRQPKPRRRKTPQARKTTQAQKTPATPTTATSTGALHPLRGGAPEQKRCIAYGSGAVPQHTRTNAELAYRTTHRRTPPCAAGPYWRQDGHGAHAATCTPAHSDTSYTLKCEELATCAQVGPERHLTGRRRDLRERTRPPSRNTWKCPHQRVLSNSPRLPDVADSGSCVSESPA